MSDTHPVQNHHIVKTEIFHERVFWKRIMTYSSVDCILHVHCSLELINSNLTKGQHNFNLFKYHILGNLMGV